MSTQAHLILASKNGHLETVKNLIEIGADVTAQDNCAVRWVSGNGHLEMVEYLVENKADITAQDNEPIRWASENGHLEVVKYIVKVGADVTAQDNGAVIWASKNGHLKMVEYLLSEGADMDKLTPKHKEYIKQKRAYSKWRRIHLRNWIRKVLIPLYYSPQNRGGIQAKKDLQAIVM